MIDQVSDDIRYIEFRTVGIIKPLVREAYKVNKQNQENFDITIKKTVGEIKEEHLKIYTSFVSQNDYADDVFENGYAGAMPYLTENEAKEILNRHLSDNGLKKI
ncbi:hypothetical protein HYZ41_03095 [archaeon]|nr:hypothetical protein [archaeon]